MELPLTRVFFFAQFDGETLFSRKEKNDGGGIFFILFLVGVQ